MKTSTKADKKRSLFSILGRPRSFLLRHLAVAVATGALAGPGVPSTASAAQLIFSSGFESPVSLPTLNQSGGGGPGWWTGQISGQDGTGTWPSTLYTFFNASWAKAACYHNAGGFSYPTHGNVLITTDSTYVHSGSRGLYLTLKNGIPSKNGSHAQYMIQSNFNPANGFYMKYWLKLNVPLQNDGQWLNLAGAKTPDGDNANPQWEMKRTGGQLRWRMGSQKLTNSSYHFVVNDSSHSIPINTWMKMEFFLKVTNTTNGKGRMMLKVNDVLIFDEVNKQVLDPAHPAAHFNRIFPVTLYTDSMYLSAPAYYAIDDIEIWDDFPSGINPPTLATIHEAEFLAFAKSSGANHTTNSDVYASPYGVSGKYTTLYSPGSEVGSYINYAVNVENDGLYNIKARIGKRDVRGKYQLQIDDEDQGSEQNYYAAATTNVYVEIDLGIKALTAGTHYFKFVCTGKDALASNYSLGVDYLALVEKGLLTAHRQSQTNGTTVVLEFPSQAGVSYTVEYATNLAAPILWQPLQTLSATGGLTQVIEPATNSARFYRVTTP